MSNLFLLSYNPYDPKVSPNQVLASVRDNKYTFQYYQPYVGTYIIKSVFDLMSLSNSYKDHFDGTTFFIAQIYPGLSGGAMSPEIWNWINTGQLPALGRP